MNDKDHGLELVKGPTGSDDVTVARLLRLAGHRPEVPAQDAVAVKQAARAEWRRAVAAERRRTFFYRGTGGLLAAAAVLLVLNTDLLRSGLAGSREPVATLAVVTGQVRAVEGAEEPGDLAPDRTLLSGTVVETAATAAGSEPSRAAFQLAGGSSIRLDAGTRVRFLSGRELALERGAVYADSGTEAGPGLEIHTALGIARDVGTQFKVRLDGAASTLEVRVREGRVILARDAGEAQTVRAGFELAVTADGAVVQRKVPSFGSSWDWTLAVLPAFDADGRPLQDLLSWAAREHGWQLRFADPALASQAAEIRVHGSVAGLTPEEAAGGFLAASGLGYRLEDGVFLVEPAGP